MRDAVAALVAAALIFFALSLLTTLHFYRKRHRKARDEERARGRTIIVELPTDPELTLFTEDAEHFYYGDHADRQERDHGGARADQRLADRRLRLAAMELGASTLQPTSFDDRPDGIARDRWDVAIETVERHRSWSSAARCASACLRSSRGRSSTP